MEAMNDEGMFQEDSREEYFIIGIRSGPWDRKGDSKTKPQGIGY